MTDEQVKRNLAKQLPKLMADCGLTQAGLATKCGENEMRISRYVRGISIPSAAALSRMADALGCSTDLLLARSVKEKPTKKAKPKP